MGTLSDLVVVDLSRVLAGPYCTMVLADLGARVIKVEMPGLGDDSRHIGPFVDGKSVYFASINRGKESVALNLKNPADRVMFDQLLARADVLVENYRPGAMDRLGYGWEALHTRFPSLVYAGISGFGNTGPYRERAAYDMVVQGMGGVMSITGHPGSPPTRVGTSVGDITAGLFGVVGILAALHERSTTGEGRFVDVGMLDCQIAILENAIARYEATGVVPGPLGARHPSIAPFQAFRCADGFVIIAAGNNALFADLARVLGAPALAVDQRFATNDDRVRNQPALEAVIERHLAVGTVTTWLTKLDAAGVPCGPLNDVGQALADPQVAARNMVITAGGHRMAGNPIKLSGIDDPVERSAAPALDANRLAIEAWLAGS